MTKQWEYQLRIDLGDELAEVARRDPNNPAIKPLADILTRHGSPTSAFTLPQKPISTEAGPCLTSRGWTKRALLGLSAPAGKEKRWIKTNPGKGWFVYFRLYGPEAPAFDGRWRPGDFEQVT